MNKETNKGVINYLKEIMQDQYLPLKTEAENWNLNKKIRERKKLTGMKKSMEALKVEGCSKPYEFSLYNLLNQEDVEYFEETMSQITKEMLNVKLARYTVKLNIWKHRLSKNPNHPANENLTDKLDSIYSTIIQRMENTEKILKREVDYEIGVIYGKLKELKEEERIPADTKLDMRDYEDISREILKSTGKPNLEEYVLDVVRVNKLAEKSQYMLDEFQYKLKKAGRKKAHGYALAAMLQAKNGKELRWLGVWMP